MNENLNIYLNVIFDFIIKCKPGSKNRADCLSRRPDYERKVINPGTILNSSNFFCTRSTIAITNNSLLEGIRASLPNDPYFNSTDNNRRLQLRNSPFSFHDDVLFYNNRIYVPEVVRIDILQSHHNTPSSGHFGITKLLNLLVETFGGRLFGGCTPICKLL